MATVWILPPIPSEIWFANLPLSFFVITQNFIIDIDDYNAYPDSISKAELCKKHEKEMDYVFGTILQQIAADAKELKYAFNHDLTDNILNRGLGVKTKQVMTEQKINKKSPIL